MNYGVNYDIFLSYRRDGGETMAILLRDRLVAKGYRVFLDVEALRSGKFNEKLLQVIENCKDFIIVLSPNSLDRCINEGDWVRNEISHALSNGKNVVPVFLRGFTWPENLPGDISELPNHNGIDAANNMYFDAAIDLLTDKFIISRPIPSMPEDIPIVTDRISAHNDASFYFPELADQDKTKRLVYTAPFIVLLVGLIAASVTYSRMALPQNIIEMLMDPAAVLVQLQWTIAMRIFWFLWLACFSASLFFVGKRLHSKPQITAPNARLLNREPYFLVKEINENIKLAKQRQVDKDFEALANAIKRLEEKLSVENDFGYGRNEIISCENNIAQQLQFLLDTIAAGDINIHISEMNTAVIKINNLLERRRELKRV